MSLVSAADEVKAAPSPLTCRASFPRPRPEDPHSMTPLVCLVSFRFSFLPGKFVKCVPEEGEGGKTASLVLPSSASAQGPITERGGAGPSPSPGLFSGGLAPHELSEATTVIQQSSPSDGGQSHAQKATGFHSHQMEQWKMGRGRPRNRWKWDRLAHPDGQLLQSPGLIFQIPLDREV